VNLLADLTGPARLWDDPELTVWRRATVKALMEVDPSLAAPPAGDPLLLDRLAQLLSVQRDRIMVTAGVRASAGPLMRVCDEVIVERPTFLGVVHALRREQLRVGTDPWERLTATHPVGTGLWFTAPCRNPDGRRADERFLAEIAAAGDKGHRIVCNTAYRWFAAMPSLPTTVIQTGTLHKLAGRGARLGWVVADSGDETLARNLAATAPPLHWQRTWGHFLAAGGADLLLRRHRQLEAARSAFRSTVGCVDEVMGHEGPNILIPVAMPEPAAVAKLAEAGVRTSPGSAFQALRPSIRVCLARIPPAVAMAAGERVAAVLS
jgi:DNA-binding transcriptional MocR family regulator